jgi:predicted HicB family RNase H-like nuclease
VQNTEDLISYHGEDIVALEQGFKDTVDDYLEFLSDSSFQDEIIKIARQKGSSKSDSQ